VSSGRLLELFGALPGPRSSSRQRVYAKSTRDLPRYESGWRPPPVPSGTNLPFPLVSAQPVENFPRQFVAVALPSRFHSPPWRLPARHNPWHSRGRELLMNGSRPASLTLNERTWSEVSEMPMAGPIEQGSAGCR
jgi:hypothetical protein